MRLLPEESGAEILAGDVGNFLVRTGPPFSGAALDLLHELSRRLMADPRVREHPDAVSFAYWCRKGSLQREAQRRADGHLRLGRGLVFHVAPGNVPVNFAFSWAFGLLSGCANVVRLSSKRFPSSELIVEHARALLANPSCAELGRSNCLLRYPSSRADLTEALSAQADARIIWGGDATIKALRLVPTQPRCVDVAFADRYSFCVLAARHVAGLPEPELAGLAENFYNDCYLMDQNACSSPHLVVWLGTEEGAQAAKARFWPLVGGAVARRYAPEAIQVMDKLVQSCRDAIDLTPTPRLAEKSPGVYRLALAGLPPGVEERRGAAGYFHEFTTVSLNEIAPVVTRKFQTMTYCGLAREELRAFAEDNALAGIDRMVPVGKALDIGLVWDGFDLPQALTRICHIL